MMPAEWHDWHDFYMLLGTASAALVALLLVAVPIGGQSPAKFPLLIAVAVRLSRRLL